jgi:hypothetical protein
MRRPVTDTKAGFAFMQNLQRAGFVTVLMLSVSADLGAQHLLKMNRASGRLVGSDLAVLEAAEKRDDLPCTVTEQKSAVIGFDLRFHASYDLSIPLRELSGTENLLTVLFRVRPLEPAGDPVFFTQKIRVPAVEEDAKGEAFLQGSFDLGEGKYAIDWLMRDRQERVCASFWNVQAELPDKDRTLEVSVKPGAILSAEREQFLEEPPVQRLSADPPLNVKVLVNFAPQNEKSSTLQPVDASALVSILRTLSRDPRIGKFSLVAFNMHEQRVLYRQELSDRIDFPQIGKSLETLQLGTVDMKRLAQKSAGTEFLAGLMRSELQDSTPYDAFVFAGPKTMLDDNVPQDVLRQIGEQHSPIYYFNYNLLPANTPWRDSIGNCVKFLKGVEYTISRPRDLWYSVGEMVKHASLQKGMKRNTFAAGPKQ